MKIMRTTAIRSLSFVLILVFAPASEISVWADPPARVTVTTKEGDQISGRLVEVATDRVVLDTKFAGRVSIRADEIASWQATDSNEHRRIAELIPQKTASRAVGAPGTVSAKNPNPAPSPSPVSRTAAKWQRGVNFAYTMARGNVNATDLNAALNVSRKEGTRRVAVSMFGRSGVRNGAPVSNLFVSTLRYERPVWHLPAFSETAIEIDRIKQLDYRFSESLGLSYPVLKREQSTLNFDFGTGLTREVFRTGLERTTASSLLRASAAQKINDRAQFTQQVTLFSDLLSPEAYRMQTDVSLTMPLTKHLALRLSGLNRYDNQPQGAARRNDFSLLTGFNISF